MESDSKTRWILFARERVVLISIALLIASTSTSLDYSMPVGIEKNAKEPPLVISEDTSNAWNYWLPQSRTIDIPSESAQARVFIGCNPLSFPRKKKAFNKKVPVRKNELRTRAYNNGSIHSTRSVRIGPGWMGWVWPLARMWWLPLSTDVPCHVSWTAMPENKLWYSAE